MKHLIFNDLNWISGVVLCLLALGPVDAAGKSLNSGTVDDDHQSHQAVTRHVGPGPNSDSTNIETLRLVHVLMRHGDRTPVVQYPKDPLQNETLWPEGFSALTKKGKMMQYRFGQYLRRRYDGFLSEVYSPREIFVQASDADRAIMSALSNLAGIFPPTEKDPKSQWNPDIPNWQPIPVHTVDKSLDNFINFGADCPRYKELKREYIERSPFALSINSKHQDLFKYLTEHTGMEVKDFEGVSDLYDTLLIQYNYNLSLPEWTKEIFPEKMAPLAPLPFDTRVIVPNKEAQLVKCGPLLKRIVKDMDVRRNLSSIPQKEKDDYRKAKLYLVSGHDSTSATLLGTLGVFDTQFPAYASAVLLEMHELPVPNDSTNGKTDFYVKVFFRNSTEVPPYEFELPNCSYPCKLDTLKSLYNDVMVDGDQWKSHCKAKN